MFKKNSLMAYSAGVLFLMSAPGFAEDKSSDNETVIESYSVELGATRIIYNPATSGAAVSVSNPNDYPVLVQSAVMTEDKAGKAPFVVTPPLFRLDPKQQSRLRLVMTGEGAAKDRETLYWMCATGIPPELGDAWAGEPAEKKKSSASLDVKIKLSQCIKVLVRPDAVKGKLNDAAPAVTWARKGDKLEANNPSPFYINIKSLDVGGKAVALPDYIPPFSSRSYAVPKGAGGSVMWTYINDYGGVSRPSEAKVR